VRSSTFVADAGAGLALVALDPAVTAETEQLAEGEGQAAVDATATAIGAQADGRVVHGDAGTVICQVARDEAFDLIVVGSHGAGVLKRVLVGSVSHHVLHHATCPVLVVRDAGADNH
jgi:nucleotide-binding universal stress UspA family protein